jgi:hypothetical protein
MSGAVSCSQGSAASRYQEGRGARASNRDGGVLVPLLVLALQKTGLDPVISSENSANVSVT